MTSNMKRVGLLIGCLAILLGGSAAAVSAQSQTDETNGEDSKKGTITGRVVDQNGQPLREVQVSVRSYTNATRGGTATTDREGNFKVEELEPFAYILTAILPGYNAAPRDPDVSPIGFYRVGDSARIEMIDRKSVGYGK